MLLIVNLLFLPTMLTALPFHYALSSLTFQITSPVLTAQGSPALSSLMSSWVLHSNVFLSRIPSYPNRIGLSVSLVHFTNPPRSLPSSEFSFRFADSLSKVLWSSTQVFLFNSQLAEVYTQTPQFGNFHQLLLIQV